MSGAGQTWAAPTTLNQLMDVLRASPSKASGGEQLRIVAGNTGSGQPLTSYTLIAYTSTFWAVWLPSASSDVCLACP